MSNKRPPNLIPEMPEKLKDFRTFLVMVWRHLNLPDPTPVQLDIANFIQFAFARRKIIEAFRGIGKSWITATYVVWRLRLDPQLKIMVLSASKDRADNFSTFCLRLINEIPVLQCLIPRNDQRCSKISFDVAPAKADQSPSVTSKGIFSQITGGRADIIIADDIEVPNNSFTQAMRDKLSEAVKEFDAILKPNGSILYLGTPQTEQSLYNQLPSRGYQVRVWTARYPTEEEEKNYSPDVLAPFILKALEANPECRGHTTDPRRFTDEDLLEREISYGRLGFQLQFMLNTKLADADRYPLKLSDLIVLGCSPTDAPEKPVWARGIGNIINDLPCVALNGDNYHSPVYIHGDWLPYKGSVMAIDPSGRGSDETVCVVLKMLNGYLYLTEMKGFKDGYSDETLQALARIAKEQNVNHIIVESNFGDGMFTKLLTPHVIKIHSCLIEEVRNSRQKELRIIDTLEPVLAQHKLIVDRNVIIYDYNSTLHLPPEQRLKYQLFYQMSRITRDKKSLAHDDRLDCLAIAVGYWVEQMGQDVDKKIEQRQNKLMKAEVKAFERAIAGKQVKHNVQVDDNVSMAFTFKTIGVRKLKGKRQ